MPRFPKEYLADLRKRDVRGELHQEIRSIMATSLAKAKVIAENYKQAEGWMWVVSVKKAKFNAQAQ